MLAKQFQNEKGGSMLEYLFLVMLIMLVAIAGVANIGNVASESFQKEEMVNAWGGQQ